MAIVYNEKVVINVSKLLSDKDDVPELISASLRNDIELMMQELFGDKVVVEVDIENSLSK